MVRPGPAEPVCGGSNPSPRFYNRRVYISEIVLFSMSLLNKLAVGSASSVLSLASINDCRADLYDDFSSGILSRDLWEVRNDTEGQPMMDQYGIFSEDNNFVFHTQNTSIGDKRTYLFPLHSFHIGDSFDYDVTTLSVNPNSWWGNLVIVTGEDYIRAGITGNSTPEPLQQLGTSHVSLIFQPNNLRFERTAPSGQLFIDNVPLSGSRGAYQLYIGSYNNDGGAHLDYDNFYLNGVPEPSTLALLGAAGALFTTNKRRRN